jgi:gentisate 1,2-dioxygenase
LSGRDEVEFTGDAREAEFRARIGGHHLAALWAERRGMDLTRPGSLAVPALWRYDAIRPEILAGGEIVTAEDAFRRVLVLENPAFPGEMRVTNTLYAGLQLVLPGEIAPCHRHSQTALRFVIEGEHAFTSVDGERAWMQPGDFIVTPYWSWHDHKNEGDGPVVWLDVLDTPLVGFLDTVFREFYPAPQQQISRPDGESPARYGANMLPVGHRQDGPATPVFHYPYAQSRAALMTVAEAGPPDPCHGTQLQYINPANGDYATATIGSYLQFLPAGFRGADYRATDATLFCAVEGTGRIVTDNGVFEWGPRDLVVVPGWHRYRLEADEAAVLFGASDRPVQEKLGLWREDRFENGEDRR